MLSQLVARAELRKIDRRARTEAARAVARRVLYEQAVGRGKRGEPADESPDLRFPRLDNGAPVVTVYAVALYYDPAPWSGAAPLMTLRQFVRAGDRPLSDVAAVRHAHDEERANWKADRAPLLNYVAPRAIVCYRVVPVPAAVPPVTAPSYGA